MTINAGIIATGGYLTGNTVDLGLRNTGSWRPRAGGGSRQVSLNGICIGTLEKWRLEQVALLGTGGIRSSLDCTCILLMYIKVMKYVHTHIQHTIYIIGQVNKN